ncbi:MAG: hypothetical protein VX589_20495 [Myxococcota bacterium]|nr:hypothetical protein [Myxococcota bacterium]
MTALLVTMIVGHDRPGGKIKARNTFENIEGVRRFQRIAERFGVVPTYLLTYPVLNDTSMDWFARLFEEGRCELGTCLQPWSNPPFEASENRLTVYPPNHIAPSAVSRKLNTLTEQFIERIGRQPTSHRAEQNGLCSASLQALERLGYAVDSSVVPGVDARAWGSIDWRLAPASPYHPSRQRPSLRGASPILQVPITAGLGQRVPRIMRRALSHMRNRVHGHSLLGKALIQTLPTSWLDPAQASSEGLRKLADAEMNSGAAYLNVAFRSEILHERCSADAASPSDVARTFERLDTFFRYSVDRLLVEPMGLSRFAKVYVSPGEPVA